MFALMMFRVMVLPLFFKILIKWCWISWSGSQYFYQSLHKMHILNFICEFWEMTLIQQDQSFFFQCLHYVLKFSDYIFHLWYIADHSIFFCLHDDKSHWEIIRETSLFFFFLEMVSQRKIIPRTSDLPLLSNWWIFLSI